MAPARTSSRISLSPWARQHRQEREQNFITNADHRFRFAQDLRQTLPVAREGSILNNTALEDPLDHLATSMLFQRPMGQPDPEATYMNRGVRGSRVSRSQSLMQQATPPFTLSKLYIRRHI